MSIALLVFLSTSALVVAGCGGGGSGSGVITADGSSTVGPFTTKAAEDFKASGGTDVTAEDLVQVGAAGETRAWRSLDRHHTFTIRLPDRAGNTGTLTP